MIDRRPALIARCRGAADVVAALAAARANGFEISVRGGGHGVAGHCVRDGAVMIDLSEMRGIHVDPVARTARVEPGVTWAELNRETQLHGLAVTGGTVSTTGISGLTLGGGLGWLMPKYGLACDNLISADVVTADGRVITADAGEHHDLHWALRGGGGSFGIVTSFEYQLHPIGPTDHRRAARLSTRPPPPICCGSTESSPWTLPTNSGWCAASCMRRTAPE